MRHAKIGKAWYATKLAGLDHNACGQMMMQGMLLLLLLEHLLVGIPLLLLLLLLLRLLLLVGIAWLGEALLQTQNGRCASRCTG